MTKPTPRPKNQKERDAGRCMIVSRRNIADVVGKIAPDLLLVSRERFTQMATATLELVEDAARQECEEQLCPDLLLLPRGKFTELALGTLELVEEAAK